MKNNNNYKEKKRSKSASIIKEPLSFKNETLYINELNQKISQIDFLCHDHKNNLIIICLDCQKLICLDCSFYNNIHRTHKLVSVDIFSKYMNDQKKEIYQIINEIVKNTKNYTELFNKQHLNLINFKNEAIQFVKNEFTNLKKSIQKFEYEYNKLINDKFDDLINKNIIFSKNNEYLNKKISDFSEEIKLFPMEKDDNIIFFQKINLFSDFNKKITNINMDWINNPLSEMIKQFENNDYLTIKKKFTEFFENTKNFISISIDNRSNIILKNRKYKISKSILPKSIKKLNLTDQMLNISNFFSKTSFVNYLKKMNIENNYINNTLGGLADIFYQSTILKNFNLFENFSKLISLPIKKAQLLYNLTKDGNSAEIFHKTCDKKGPYIVIIKVNSDSVFGYFCPFSFEFKNEYEINDLIFIFSLYKSGFLNKSKYIIQKNKNYLAFHHSKQSPCLGCHSDGKSDLFIDFDDLSNSFSNLGYVFESENKEKINSKSELTGSCSPWIINEIEIFSLMLN